MIIEEAENLLKNWNKGILDGAKTNLAKELNISPSKISDCLSGRQNPSKNMIKKMASIFGKPEEEIRRIFCTQKESSPYTQNNIRSKGHFQQIINGYKEEALAAQIRTLEAKLDLIIQLMKNSK